MAKQDTQEENSRGKLGTKKYLKELRRLQAELGILQDWIKHKGLLSLIHI